MSDSKTPIPSVEELISAAGDFLEVDPFLRPEVVEQATAVRECNRAWQRGGVIATALLCITVPLALIIPAAATDIPSSATRDLTKIEDADRDSGLGSNALERSDSSWGMLRRFQQLSAERCQAFRGIGNAE